MTATRSKLAPTALLVLALAAGAEAGKVEVWRHDTAPAFNRGRKAHVVVSDAGRVRLSRDLHPAGDLSAAHVWDLARSKDSVYAATGDEGKVFRRDGQGAWVVALDVEDSQVLSLATLPNGQVVCGTGPGGRVIDVTDPKHPASRPDPAVQYIWDLASDANGNLYAATGSSGQLWKRAGDGTWSRLLDSKHAHLLCVAVGPDGSAYAGSDGEGLIYKVAPDGKASVVYDAPQAEVHALAFGPDGSLYAGTAADASGGPGGSPGRTFGTGLSDSAAPAPGAARVAAAAGAQLRPGNPAAAEAVGGGTATPRPVAPGENAVYRIGADGAAREVFRARALIFALTWQGDRLLVGTGPEGQLYEVRGEGRESSPLARIDHGQVLSLLADASGEVLLGAGDPGGVFRLQAGHAEAGTLISDVLDTRLASRFGALTWRADRPAKTAVTVQVRTGNVGEPDETWSDWSAPQVDPDADAAVAPAPPGRFAQYRATLRTGDPAATPELRAVALHYQTVNLPPEISRIDVPDLREGDGATRQTRLALKWEATDPNGDDLEFSLFLRKEGWPDWVRLGEAPLAEKTYSWDTTAVPAGVYRLRVAATDRPSNPASESFARELTSEPFLVDHQAPGVTVTPKGKGATVALKDDLTRLVKAAYALDGGDWVPIFPADNLFDSTRETIEVPLPDLKPGTHVLMVRATDAAGNVGTGDAVLKAP